jgi:signal transduction histidine kinase
MKRFGIRSRVLLAAILPVIAVAILLGTIFVVVEVTGLDRAHEQRAIALARQVAASAEFALFTDNQPALQALLQATRSEPDLAGVTIANRDGAALVGIGSSPPGVGVPPPFDATTVTSHQRARVVVQPILASDLPIGDAFEDRLSARPILMGYVVLELSRQGVLARERALIIAMLLTGLGALLFGSVLAVALSRGVTRPMLHLSEVVERFGRGALDARASVGEANPLHPLADGINRMAGRIEQSREELERRVADATEELRLKKDEAEKANLAKTRFLAAASHDLRQPIHALRLFAESLREEVPEETRAGQLLQRIQRSIDTTSTMFDALLDVSKLDAGVIQATPCEFPIQTLLSGLQEMYTPVALSKGLRFSVVRSRAWVRSDPVLLERLLQNLVSNAMKYTIDGGVLVGCRRRGGTIRVEVWDTGSGIAPEHHDQIFQEFFQVGRPRAAGAQGLGLGLAIVQRIAGLLDHPLQVRSQLERGSMFAIELPGAAPSSVVPAPPLPLATEAGFVGTVVALVDDEVEILDAMRELLQRWGCTLIAARSESELLRRLEASAITPDLLICDYRLGPGANGFSVVENMRHTIGRDVPALIITGDVAGEHLQEAQSRGYELLHKPVAPAKLRQIMRVLLSRARRRNARR